jgi:hypothetical protein
MIGLDGSGGFFWGGLVGFGLDGHETWFRLGDVGLNGHEVVILPIEMRLCYYFGRLIVNMMVLLVTQVVYLQQYCICRGFCCILVESMANMGCYRSKSCENELSSLQ